VLKEEKEVRNPAKTPSFQILLVHHYFRNNPKEGKMRKWMFVAMVALLALSLVVGCGPAGI